MARLPKQHNNETVFSHLNDYMTLSMFNLGGNPKAVAAMDDILTGITLLDFGGNTRPLSKTRLFALLATLPTITSAAVQEVLECSEQHARRLAMALRTASLAFAAQIDRWNTAGEADQLRSPI